jgi:hypothetical protein
MGFRIFVAKNGTRQVELARPLRRCGSDPVAQITYEREGKEGVRRSWRRRAFGN